MDFSLCDRSALRRCCLSVFLTICSAFSLPVMSAGDALTLQLTQPDRLPQTVTSLKQLNARAGDMLSLSSEFGEDFAFRVESVRFGICRASRQSPTGGRLPSRTTFSFHLSCPSLSVTATSGSFLLAGMHRCHC